MRLKQIEIWRNIACILLGMTVNAAALSAQSYIYWDKDSVLTWDDFHIKDDKASEYLPVCGIEVFFDTSVKDSINWHVRSYFDVRLSWKGLTCNDRIQLSISKCYFELTEIAARELRQEFVRLNNEGRSSMFFYRRAHKRILKELNERVNKFKREVKEGTDHLAYVTWREQIITDLQTSARFYHPDYWNYE